MSGTKTAIVVTLAILVTVVSAAPARASTVHTSSVQGFEVFFTSTEGVFTGSASGDLSGSWIADVLHEPLTTSAAITGGSFNLRTTLEGQQTRVSGSFDGGSVVQQSGFTGCTNQTYAVAGVLDSVGPAGTVATGTGSFDVTLTHYRVSIFGRCVSSWASVVGTVTLSF
jgi:hypothetical protein